MYTGLYIRSNLFNGIATAVLKFTGFLHMMDVCSLFYFTSFTSCKCLMKYLNSSVTAELLWVWIRWPSDVNFHLASVLVYPRTCGTQVCSLQWASSGYSVWQPPPLWNCLPAEIHNLPFLEVLTKTFQQIFLFINSLFSVLVLFSFSFPYWLLWLLGLL